MDFEIIRSKRRTMCLQVKRDGSVLVRAPLHTSEKVINDFVSNHIKWIEKKQELVKNAHMPEDFDKNEVKILKERAKNIIEPILEKYSNLMELVAKFSN